MNAATAHVRFHAARRTALPLADLVATGLLVGTLDFLACSLYWAAQGVPPARIAQSLGEMAIGAAALAPGLAGVATGVLVEAAIGLCFVSGYLLLATMAPRVNARPLRNGMAYGALAFAVFEWIVVPLSAAAPRTPSPEWQLVLLAIHMAVLGIPTATLARRRFAPGRPPMR